MVPKDPPAPGLCTDQPVGLFPERSVWMVQSSMLFMRRKVRDTVGFMDESVGVGANTKYQSGEETDYFLRAMQAGFRLWFEPSLKVFHPELRELPRIRKINTPTPWDRVICCANTIVLCRVCWPSQAARLAERW